MREGEASAGVVESSYEYVPASPPPSRTPLGRSDPVATTSPRPCRTVGVRLGTKGGVRGANEEARRRIRDGARWPVKSPGRDADQTMDVVGMVVCGWRGVAGGRPGRRKSATEVEFRFDHPRNELQTDRRPGFRVVVVVVVLVVGSGIGTGTYLVPKHREFGFGLVWQGSQVRGWQDVKGR